MTKPRQTAKTTKPTKPTKLPSQPPALKPLPAPPQPQRHIDGTLCKEGTQRIPDRFTACCEEFANHTLSCDFDVRYEWWEPTSMWVIAVAETAGGGGIAIHFCPHCGKTLQGSRKPKAKGRYLDVGKAKTKAKRARR